MLFRSHDYLWLRGEITLFFGVWLFSMTIEPYAANGRCFIYGNRLRCHSEALQYDLTGNVIFAAVVKGKGEMAPKL